MYSTFSLCFTQVVVFLAHFHTLKTVVAVVIVVIVCVLYVVCVT